MGDPRHLEKMPYNVGTSDRNGSFPRQLPHQSCEYYADRIQSYCDSRDQACDGGSDPLVVHTMYVRKYKNDAVKFIKSKLGF